MVLHQVGSVSPLVTLCGCPLVPRYVITKPHVVFSDFLLPPAHPLGAVPVFGSTLWSVFIERFSRIAWGNSYPPPRSIAHRRAAPISPNVYIGRRAYGIDLFCKQYDALPTRSIALFQVFNHSRNDVAAYVWLTCKTNGKNCQFIWSRNLRAAEPKKLLAPSSYFYCWCSSAHGTLTPRLCFRRA